ncbi:hypothetical protein NPIL_196461 [Nephila pilipes]|uniref:MATH domain-containing protein n=1 Tax=Nephila pilipes TaxID=299642 RepID=A0A8X6TM22_NEPPI|nr:hypothetical protein NPIL_196461 [Nephila pilipes]
MQRQDKGGAEFSLQWTIENFSHVWQRTGEKLVSPIFFSHLQVGSYWTLELYPRGKSNDQHIACFFRINAVHYIPNCDVHYEIIATRNCGASSRAHVSTIPFGETRGRFPFLMRRSEIEHGNQPQNLESLTLKCRITVQHNIHKFCLVESRVKTHILIRRISYSLCFTSDISHKIINIKRPNEANPFATISIKRNQTNEHEIQFFPQNREHSVKYYTCKLTIDDVATKTKFWECSFEDWDALKYEYLLVNLDYLRQSQVDSKVGVIQNCLLKFNFELTYSTGQVYTENEKILSCHVCEAIWNSYSTDNDVIS